MAINSFKKTMENSAWHEMYRDGHIFLYSVMGGVVHIVNWEGEGFKKFFLSLNYVPGCHGECFREKKIDIWWNFLSPKNAFKGKGTTCKCPCVINWQ